MSLYTDPSLVRPEDSRSPTRDAAPEFPSHWSQRVIAVAQEIFALRDPARRETRWRIALLTFAVFASLC